jgi:hypothetical protein
MGILALATTALTVSAQRKAAGAQQVELEIAKREESSAARDREVQRKRRITAILGAQSADAAAKGISLSGSVANISIEDARRASEESMIDDVSTRARIDALSRRSRSIGRLQKLRSATTIFKAAEDAIKRG